MLQKERQDLNSFHMTYEDNESQRIIAQTTLTEVNTQFNKHKEDYEKAIEDMRAINKHRHELDDLSRHQAIMIEDYRDEIRQNSLTVENLNAKIH